MRLQKTAAALFALVIFLYPVRGQEADEETKDKIEATSPDGKFAFRYGKTSDSDADADSENDSDSDGDIQTYELIEKKSGKQIKTVAKADPEIGPSARFNMEVLWRPDSKAFAITATFWKRGSTALVFVRDGATFREIKVPDLDTDIPDKVKKGKKFEHVSELNSQTAKKWQKDGSLIVDVETIIDGNEQGLSITAKRTVVLGFDRSDKAKILNSTIKYATAKY
jgi:hypothetical protein